MDPIESSSTVGGCPQEQPASPVGDAISPAALPFVSNPTMNSTSVASSSTVNPNFIVYFSFETAAGGTKTFKVLYGDLLKAHGGTVLTCTALKYEAITLLHTSLNNEPTTTTTRHETLQFEYKDPHGIRVGIQREQDLCYALADSMEQSRLFLYVSVDKPAPTAQPTAPEPIAVARPKKVAASPKRATTKPRKKTIKATTTTTTTTKVDKTSVDFGSAQPVAVPSSTSGSQQQQLSGVELKIFLALAECHALGIRTPLKQHIALLSNYKNVGSKAFVKGLKLVKQLELVTEVSMALQLTSNGIQCIPSDLSPPESNEALKQRLLRVVNHKTAGQMYDFLFDGKVWDRKALATALNYSNLGSKAFREGMNVLKSLGFLECPDSTTLRLGDIAFPYGRPSE